MSFHVWEGEGETGREGRTVRKGEGGAEGKYRGGEKLDADNPTATFFPSLLVHSGRNPKKIKDKGGKAKKSSTLDYNCCFHPDVGAPVPWTPLCVCLRINVDLNYWINHQHKVWLFVDFTGVCGEVTLASAAPTPTFCFYLLFIVSAAGLNVWHRRPQRSVAIGGLISAI